MNTATARIENANTFHGVALEKYAEGRDGVYGKGKGEISFASMWLRRKL